MASRDSELVWSSDGGDTRKRPPKNTGGGPTRSDGGRVKVRRETAGRKGKTATTVSNIPLNDEEVKALAGRLKKRCGVGGSAKDCVIEIQGDHREKIVALLESEGFDVVLASG